MSIRNTSKWSEAESFFNQLHMKPSFSLFGFGFSSSIDFAKDDTDANFVGLLESCPEFYPAWFQRAEYRLRMGNDKDGEEFFEQGFRHFCDIVTDPDEFCNLLFHWIENLVTLLRYELVVRTLERAIGIFPEEPALYDELAFCMIQTSHSKEQSDKAIQYQQRALDEDPDNDYYISNMGWLYFVTGDYDKAEQLFQNAIDYNHENETAFENLEMTQYVREHGLNYQQYLLRPVDKKEIKVLLDCGDVDEAREIAQNYNRDRLQAFKELHLKQGDIDPHELLGITRVVETFLEIIEPLVPDDVLMVEEVDIIAGNIKQILWILLDGSDFMDSGTLEFFNKSIARFYDYLASLQLSDTSSVERFKKDFDAMVRTLAANLEEYYVVLRDVTLSESEREKKLSTFF